MRGHLDVEGGREESQNVEGGKEEAPARKGFLEGRLLVTLVVAKSDVFKCFFVQKKLSQSFAVTKCQDA